MKTQSRAGRAGIVTQTKRTPERVERRETFLRRRPAEDFATEDTLLLTTPDEMTAQGANDNGASSFYFRVNPDGDNYATFNTGANVAMRLSLHYLDVGTETLTIGYSTNGSSENATKTLVTKTNTGRWLWAHKKITARVNHSIYSSQDNADFRVYSTAAFYANGARLRANAEQVIVNWKADQFDDDLRDENAYYGDDPDLIGAWAISETYLIYDTDDDATSAGLAPLDYPFYAGATYANRASAPFRVTPAGALYSTSGQIANWDIGVVDAYTISADNGKVKLNSQTPYISLGNTVGMSAGTPTGKGVFFRKDGGDFDLFAGDINGSDGDKSYVWYDGSAGTWTFHNVPLKGYNTSHVQTWSIDQRGNAWFGKSSSNKLIEWSTTGGTAGDFRAGGNDDYFFWDDSASTAYVKGNVEISGELHTAIFVKDVVRVESGTLVVAKNAGILNAAVTTAAGSQTLNIKDNAGAAIAAVNDILRIKTLAGNNWFTVTAVGALSGGARNYTATRNSGSNATFAKGTAVTNYGVSGQGILYATSDASNGPYYSVITHAGSPWSAETSKARLGKLDGITDATFGALTGYGLWTDNIYLTGSINATAGTISGVLSIGASGGFYQGTGTFGSPTTGLKIYNSSGVGLLEMWGSGTKQVYFNSSGQLVAGGGADILDSNGIQIATGTSDVNSLRWMDGSNEVLQFSAYHPDASNAEAAFLLNDGVTRKTNSHFYISSFDSDAEQMDLVVHKVLAGGYVTLDASDTLLGLRIGGISQPSSLLHIASTAPTFRLEDTTPTAKSALFTLDANKLILSEVGGAANNLTVWDLANARVGILNASPSTALDVTGAVTISGDVVVDTNVLYVNTSTNRIGINRTPGKTLDISGTDQPLIRMTYTNSSSSSVGPAIDFYANGGAAISNTHRIGAFQFGGAVDASNTLYASAFVLATATENWSGTAGGSKMVLYTTPNTTQTPTLALTVGQDQSALFTNSIKSSSATAGVGYTTGAGGTVTQATSRTTGVTLNKVCGQITLVSAAGSTTWQTFTVTNSAVATTDVPVVVQDSGTDLYEIHVTAVGAGTFNITFRTTGGTTTEQPVFSFALLKAVTA